MEKNALIELIRKSKDGDMDAMEQLLLYAHTSVSYQCRKMLKSEQDVEDMTQEILLTVYQKLDTLQEPAAFHKWLHQITASRCINTLTRTHVDLQFAEDEDGNSVLDNLEELDEQKVPDKWLDNKETTRMIEEIVSGLPEAQRMCTLMFYYSELSVKEIAQLMKVSENTIKSRLNYARKAIKEKVLDYEKQGIKLYGLSPLPFLLFFLRKMEAQEKNPVSAQLMVDKVLSDSSMAAAGIAGTAGSAASSSASAAIVGSTTTGFGIASISAATSTSFSTFLGLIPTKIIVSATAALFLVGGTAAATHYSNTVKESPAPSIQYTVPVNVLDQQDEYIMYPTIPEETIDCITDPTSPYGNHNNRNNTPAAIIDYSDNHNQNKEKDKEDDCTSTTADEQSSTQPTEAPTENRTYDDHAVHYLTTISNPNCTEGGIRVSQCSVGGEIITQEIGPTSHNMKYHITVEPTNTTDGYIEYVCSICGYTEHREYHEHSWAQSASYPSCTKRGSVSRHCAKCTCKEILYYIDPKGHNWGEWITVVQPTTTSEGIAERTCSTCKEQESRVIPTLVETHIHTYMSSITAEPTCNKYGIMTYTCKCGDTYTENIPFNDEHDYIVTYIEPNCIGIGYTRYECSQCFTYYRENIIPRKGHSYITTVVAPTETEKGYTKNTCSVCNTTNYTNYTDPLGPSEEEHIHSYVSSVVAPTQTSQGYTEYTCSGCGNSYRDQYIDPPPTPETESTTPPHTHSYVSTVYEPNEVEQGYTEHVCTGCGDTYRDNYTDKLNDRLSGQPD